MFDSHPQHFTSFFSLNTPILVILKSVKNLKIIGVLFLAIVIIGVIFISKNPTPSPTVEKSTLIISGSFDKSKTKSEEEWKKILTQQQFNILREKGTETPFSGELLDEKRKGTYYSVGCDQAVFRSEQKYDSGTGWPSFWDPFIPDSIVLQEDNELGQKRVEVLDKCGGHLGHVFDDGPNPTGKRYCINSLALRFVPDKD